MRRALVGLVAVLAMLALSTPAATDVSPAQPGGAAAARPSHAADRPSNVYLGFRSLALGRTPHDFGLTPTGPGPTAFGIVMDIGFERGVATVAGFSSGDASLYLSHGGGIIGGIDHKIIRDAAQAWVASAQPHLTSLKATTTFPLPAAGEVRIYVLTDRGVLAARSTTDDLDRGGPEWSPIWQSAQVLIAAIHQVSDSPKAP